MYKKFIRRMAVREHRYAVKGNWRASGMLYRSDPCEGEREGKKEDLVEDS